MSHQEDESEIAPDSDGHIQRAEGIAIQRSILFFARAATVAIIPCLFTGIWIGASDHFTLQKVQEIVVSTHNEVGKITDDSTRRNEDMTRWRATMDGAVMELRAKEAVLESRINAKTYRSEE